MVNFIIKKSINKEISRAITFLMIALLLLRDLVGIGINKYVFVSLAAICLVLLDRHDIYVFVALITPFCHGVSYSYIVLIALACFLIKSKHISINIGGFWCIVGIVFLELISIVYGNWSLLEFLKFIGIFFFSFLRMIGHDDNYDNERIVDAFLTGMAITVFSILGQMVVYYGLGAFLKLDFALIRIGNLSDFTGKIVEGQRVIYNANGLCTLCIQSVLLSLLRYSKEKKVKYLFFIIICLVVGLLTQSRMFFVVGIAFFISYFLLQKKTKVITAKKIIWIGFGLIGLFFLFRFFLYDSWSALLNRFEVEDLTNGRTDIFQYYFIEMMKSPKRLIFGVGMQNYMDKYESLHACHNATQEIFVMWGVVGAILIIFLIFISFLRLRWRNYEFKTKLLYMLPFLCTFVCMQFGQGFYDMPSMLRLMVMFSAINMINSGENNDYNNSIYSNI